jgi:hypothetical protein
MFLIFVRIYRISFFSDCRPKILGGIMWSPQKETSISNSKISLYFLPFSENESVRLYDVSLPANSWSTRTPHVLRNWRRLPFAWFQGIDTGKICSKECSFPLLNLADLHVLRGIGIQLDRSQAHSCVQTSQFSENLGLRLGEGWIWDLPSSNNVLTLSRWTGQTGV